MEAESTEDNGSWTTECSYAIKFTWNVAHFSALETERISSDPFAGGSHKWRIVIFPEGDDVDNHLSVFLEADDDVLDNIRSIRVKYRLSVVSVFDEQTVIVEDEATFGDSVCVSTSGWSLFLSHDKLDDPDRGFLINDTLIITAEVWFNREKEETVVSHGTKRKFISSHQEQSLSSFARLKTLFGDIQNQIKDLTDKSFSDEEIAEAKANYKNCLNMDVTSFIRSGKVPELKRVLSLLLTAKAFPKTMVDGATKFLADLDEHCKNYEAAQRDLREVQEYEDSASELKAALKELSSKFTPVRNQVDAIDIELAKLGELMDERKGKRARLGKKLDDLAEQATSSKRVLFCVERKRERTGMKKSGANETIRKFHIIWESLKDIKAFMI